MKDIVKKIFYAAGTVVLILGAALSVSDIEAEFKKISHSSVSYAYKLEQEDRMEDLVTDGAYLGSLLSLILVKMFYYMKKKEQV